tara:strand:+ start:79 stop:498 length:420 start_codon:yes stop_codon:yes gene_type:complete
MEKGTITLRLNPLVRGVPNYKKTSKAVKKVKSLLQRHTKSEDVRIGPYLNNKLWSQGRKNPPNKIQVEITKKEDYFLAELPDAPKPKEEEPKKGKKKEKKEEKKEVKKAPEKEDKKPVEVKKEKEDKSKQETKGKSSPK